MKGNKPLILRLLLIAVMVLQPMVSAYAMTAMNHNPGSVASSPVMHGHEMDHDAMQQTMDEYASPASAEDCCASNAACSMMSCGVALPQNPISITTVATSLVAPAYQISWVGILQPTEIRPPRNILL